MNRTRDPLLWAGTVLMLAALVIGGLEAVSWIGRPFPGFLVLGNRVVASAGLRDWPATRGGEIYQHQVVALDGRPLAAAAEIQRHVDGLPPGTPVAYRFARGAQTLDRAIATRLFTGLDFLLLFGAFLFCGLGLCGTALLIRFMRGRDRIASGTAFALWLAGMYALTALDLYGPWRLFRLHVLVESFLFAGGLHMVLVFPQPHRMLQRHPWLLRLPYGAAALLAVVAQLGLHDPAVYAVTHRIALTAFGADLALFVVWQLWNYLRPPSFEARQRVKILAFGTVVAFLPQVALLFSAAISGGQVPENVIAWSGGLFPLVMGYALLRHNLFEVDAILRRSVTYALLTAAVALAYAGAVAGIEASFHVASPWTRGTFVLFFAMVVVTVLLPLRDRVQSAVDRLFFRAAYDFRRVVERTSASLASAVELEPIALELVDAADRSLHPEWIFLAVRRHTGGGPLEGIAQRGAPPAGVVDITRVADREPRPFETSGGGLGVPFRVEGELIALLLLGRRLSGRLYGGDDRRFLHTLANQGAVAIQRALALDELRTLNRELERKVDARTSELARAISELQETQAQLVHQEKMASIGQLVAGIAHEINNPVNFIEGNLHYLREYTESLTGALADFEAVLQAEVPSAAAQLAKIREHHELDYVIGDLESVLMGCREGVDRTTTLVRDLRTFSRLDQPECSPLDVHEALESTLSLLRSRLAGIELVKEYGDVPPVECLASQVNQVFMNLLANAADAVGPGGRILIRTSRPDADRVRIEIEDDGCGIPPELLDRIFEPFFTTKAVGHGTGLGLAISYGVVVRHGGTIRVRSEPGRGTCFEVNLPIDFSLADHLEGLGAKPLAGPRA